MSKSQPTYTKEFKQQAVHVFESSGKNKTQIARDLGISESALSKCVRNLGNTAQKRFLEKGINEH